MYTFYYLCVVRTVISRIRDHDIRVGGYAVCSPLAIRLMNNFHPFVQLRPAACLRERKKNARDSRFSRRIKDSWDSCWAFSPRENVSAAICFKTLRSAFSFFFRAINLRTLLKRCGIEPCKMLRHGVAISESIFKRFSRMRRPFYFSGIIYPRAIQSRDYLYDAL